jgi:hypothetical protein
MFSPSLSLYIVLFLLCLALSAFFSGSEAAFLAASRLRLRTLVAKKVPRAHRVLALAERTDRLLANILLGNNIVNTAAAAMGTAILTLLLGSQVWGVVTATLVVATLLLVLGELVPKTLAAGHPERFTLRLVVLVEWAERLLLPSGGPPPEGGGRGRAPFGGEKPPGTLNGGGGGGAHRHPDRQRGRGGVRGRGEPLRQHLPSV